DGIRDWSVTGVQTCALPIYRAPVLETLSSVRTVIGSSFRVQRSAPGNLQLAEPMHCDVEISCLRTCADLQLPSARQWRSRPPRRSEERRVGEECICRGASGD